MLNTLQMIELAENRRIERSAGNRHPVFAPERAGPTARARLGRRVIAFGERIAYGTSLTATR